MPRRRFNWLVSDLLRKGLKRTIEWSARLKGQRFYCAALAGASDYNITINCDLTVSCNCQDYDGSGHLGDLNQHSFKEVFFGPVARDFRESLARGKLPINTCTRCSDLRRVPKSEVKATSPGASGDPAMLACGPAPRLPWKGLLLENTVRCNLACIGCDRESAARIRTSRQMDLDRLTRMADLTSELGLEQLFFLNLGEPFLSPNIGPELQVLRRKNPNCEIIISTNGLVLDKESQREAALNASQIFFSVAGVDDRTLQKYEPRAGFEKVWNNMKSLVAYRNARGLAKPLIYWKYLLFNWNDRPQLIRRAIELAKAAGVDAIYFCPTSNPFYGISWRYRFGLLNSVGASHWRGREVSFR